MSCSNLTAGITTGCNNSIGGIKQIAISKYEITGFVQDSNGVINYWTWGTPPGLTPPWYYFDVDTGAASFTETYEVNKNASILGFRQSVTIQLNGMDAATQQTIAEIAESNFMQCMVQDNMNRWWTLGITRGAGLESGSTTTGTAYTDTKASTLTITAVEPTSTYQVNSIVAGSIWLVQVINWNEQNPTVIHQFGSGTRANARCEFDDFIAYNALSTSGSNSPQYGGPLLLIESWPPTVGAQLYDYDGTPITSGTSVGWTFDNPRNDAFEPFVPPYPKVVNTDMYIIEATNGIITHYDIYTNIACGP